MLRKRIMSPEMREQSHNHAKERAFRTIGPLVRKFSPDRDKTMGILKKVFDKLPEERLTIWEIPKGTWREITMHKEKAEQRVTIRKVTRNLLTYAKGNNKIRKKI